MDPNHGSRASLSLLILPLSRVFAKRGGWWSVCSIPKPDPFPVRAALPPLLYPSHQVQTKGVALSVLRQMAQSLADDALSSSEVRLWGEGR